MRENQIKIEPFEFVSIQELKIMRTVNDHARASVSVQIKDAWEERYIGILIRRNMGENNRHKRRSTYRAFSWDCYRLCLLP